MESRILNSKTLNEILRKELARNGERVIISFSMRNGTFQNYLYEGEYPMDKPTDDFTIVFRGYDVIRKQRSIVIMDTRNFMSQTLRVMDLAELQELGEIA